ALDLLGEDLLTARVDAHPPAPEQLDRTVVEDRCDIAGEHPALAGVLDEGRRRLVGIVVVADRDVPAPRDPTLPAAARPDHLERVRVEHEGFVVETGERPPTEAARLRAGLRGAVPVVEDRVR